MKQIAITLAFILTLLVFGCSRQYKTMASGSDNSVPFSRGGSGISRESMVFQSGQEEFPSTEVSETAMLDNYERKLVKSAYIRIRVENLEAANNSVLVLLGKYSAYAASTTIQENSHHYSLRVPSYQYDAFLTEMNGMGRLIQRTENTEDVTLRYYDLAGRIESMRELLRTFQSYLGKAKNIEEILSVESRIADLQREIEFTGTQLRNLANRVDYSTIDLNLLGPAAASLNQGETLDERIRQLFGGFGGFLSTAAVILLGIVIYGIPVLALAALFFWVLFGRIGLMKKLWRLLTSKQAT